MEEFEYPMWFKSKISNQVVRFDNLYCGEVIVKGIDSEDGNAEDVGFYLSKWIEHTNANRWIDVTDQYKEKVEIPQLEMCGTPKCVHDMPYDSECEECQNEITRPKVSHYQGLGIEPIDYINSHNFNFNLGNAIKYISRCGKKEGESVTKDLKKAIDYLNFEIERVNNVEK